MLGRTIRNVLPDSVTSMLDENGGTTNWHRGELKLGQRADINVIDFENLSLSGPEYVHDFPGGAGRYIQRGSGYDATIVNGRIFMENGEHTGELAGVTLRSTD